MRDHVRFLGSFLRSPVSTGAVAPSSRWLADRMIDGLGLDEARTVVELGPGTGSFTRVILERLRPGSRFLAVEVNEAFARTLSERFPEVRVINDSAENLSAQLAEEGLLSADCIVSGLPWAAFPVWLQARLLRAAVRALAPGGRFVTFAYVHAVWLPPARRFRRLLAGSFERVEASRVVWRNLPPAFVYRCLKVPPGIKAPAHGSGRSPTA